MSSPVCPGVPRNQPEYWGKGTGDRDWAEIRGALAGHRVPHSAQSQSYLQACPPHCRDKAGTPSLISAPLEPNVPPADGPFRQNKATRSLHHSHLHTPQVSATDPYTGMQLPIKTVQPGILTNSQDLPRPTPFLRLSSLQGPPTCQDPQNPGPLCLGSHIWDSQGKGPPHSPYPHIQGPHVQVPYVWVPHIWDPPMLWTDCPRRDSYAWDVA